MDQLPHTYKHGQVAQYDHFHSQTKPSQPDEWGFELCRIFQSVANARSQENERPLFGFSSISAQLESYAVGSVHIRHRPVQEDRPNTLSNKPYSIPDTMHNSEWHLTHAT